MIKSTYKRLINNTGFNGRRLNAFPLGSGVRQRYPCSPFFLRRVVEVLASIVGQEKGKKKKKHTYQKGRNKTNPDDVVVNIENPKEGTWVDQLVGLRLGS